MDFLKTRKRDIDPSTQNNSHTVTLDIVGHCQNFVTSWKSRKEKICTYKEHIGHYKAIMKNNFLSWLLFQRSDILDKPGYPPKHHRECTDLMI